MKTKTMTRARAIRQGTKDGIEDAELVTNERGHEAAASCESWAAMARSVNVASIMAIPVELEEVYYAAYDAGARKRVSELAPEEDFADADSDDVEKAA